MWRKCPFSCWPLTPGLCHIRTVFVSLSVRLLLVSPGFLSVICHGSPPTNPSLTVGSCWVLTSYCRTSGSIGLGCFGLTGHVFLPPEETSIHSQGTHTHTHPPADTQAHTHSSTAHMHSVTHTKEYTHTTPLTDGDPPLSPLSVSTSCVWQPVTWRSKPLGRTRAVWPTWREGSALSLRHRTPSQVKIQYTLHTDYTQSMGFLHCTSILHRECVVYTLYVCYYTGRW